MAGSEQVIVVFDDHDFRGHSISSIVDGSGIAGECLFHNTAGGIRIGELESRLDVTSPTILALVVTGSAALCDPTVMEGIACIRAALPAARIAILCDDTSADSVAFAVEHDLDGIVPTHLTWSVATAALQFILAGGYYFPHAKLCTLGDGSAPSYRQIDAKPVATAAETAMAPAMAAAVDPLPATLVIEASPADEPALTARQADVLEALCQGASNKVIARSLDISEATVKIHVRQLLRKYNATNRTQIVIRKGAQQPEEIQAA